ncbi:MAG: T9SS type A sorting domain-containing protein [candidate division WOR-3 bacterium]
MIKIIKAKKILIFAFFSLLWGQWLETRIFLPESGPSSLYYACWDSIDNKVYFASSMGWQLFVIDGERNELLKAFRLPNYVYSLIYNPIVNKIYCGIYRYILVFDCRTDSLIKTIPFPTPYPDEMILNTKHNKLYVVPWWSTISYVIDCYKDSVIKLIPLCVGAYDPGSDRVYALSNRRLTILDGKSDSIIKTVNEFVNPSYWTLNTRNNKYYFVGEDNLVIKIFDGKNDSLIKKQFAELGEFFGGFVYNPINNKIYCAVINNNIGEDTLSIPVIDGEIDSLNERIILSTKDGGASVFYNSINNKLYCIGEIYMNSIIFHRLWVIDCASHSIIREFEMPQFTGYTWNKKNNRFYISAANCSVYVFRDEIPGIYENPSLLKAKDFKILPNLGNSFKIFSQGNEETKIEIYNSFGRKVKSFNLKPGASFFIGELSSGIYFLKAKKKENIDKLIFVK